MAKATAHRHREQGSFAQGLDLASAWRFLSVDYLGASEEHVHSPHVDDRVLARGGMRGNLSSILRVAAETQTIPHDESLLVYRCARGIDLGEERDLAEAGMTPLAYS